jgi:vancomycin resistance protein YoaR
LSAVGFTSYLFVDWSNNYQNKIYPGVKIGKINLSGLTIEEANNLLDQESEKIYEQGLTLSYNGKNLNLPAVNAVNTDLGFPIFTFDIDKTTQTLSDLNPKNSFSAFLINTLTNTFEEKDIPVSYTLDRERTKAYIEDSLKDYLIKPVNASFATEKTGFNDIAFKIIPERIGKDIDFDLAFSEIDNNLSSLNSQDQINLKTITTRPSVNAKDLEGLQDAAKSLINRGDLILKTNLSDQPSFTVKKEILASWIRSEGTSGNYQLGLDEEKISKYLEENISTKIDQEAKLSRYEIKDGKMVSWQNGENGRKLNIKDSVSKIKEQYLINQANYADLIVDTVESDLNSQPENKIDIQEIIGTGHSNFAGSPANRRHNIKVGSDAVNGILIPPGEEFSLVKTLGEIDAKSGYLPELVIKENKTIPEYGGGLCQVGTTMFRSALASGLPITARQNHSYRVAYYEPAGTDAAIYDPWPDMRFLNDTGNYILIQSRITGNDIYFDFWGKKDGRVASSSKPVVYNITKPAPAKIIETTDLKPGEKKCTEKAHNGADAYFNYSVNYPDGNVKNVKFKSHYVPWQEVCLVGKQASSTIPIISSSTIKTVAPKTATSTN